MHEDTSEKKSERLEVRLGYREKQSFVEACDSQGDTPSSALRRFIRGYVRRADTDRLASAWRGLGRRRYGILAGASLISAALVAGVFAFSAKPSLIETTNMDALKTALEEAEAAPQTGERLTGQAALDAAKAAGPQPIPDINMGLFNRLDKNADGRLTRGEILPSDHHVHRLLDVDGEAGIAPEEFYASGNMQYKLAESWDMIRDGASKRLGHTGEDETINVEFELIQTPPLIHAARPLEDAVIARPDRTVIWETGATKPFLVFTNDTHPERK
jgi:hypothetical protein